MGGDYFADEEGKLKIKFRNKDDNFLGEITMRGLDPGEEVHKSLIRGRNR